MRIVKIKDVEKLRPKVDLLPENSLSPFQAKQSIDANSPIHEKLVSQLTQMHTQPSTIAVDDGSNT